MNIVCIVYTLGDSLITEVTEAVANKNRLDFNDAALVAAAAAGNKLGCLSVTSSASGVILKLSKAKLAQCIQRLRDNGHF